jgi:hypothetical protein
MFNFVAQLTALAHEADSGARQALAASGMLDSAYWASAALLELLLAALQATIIVGMTWALRFDLVRGQGQLQAVNHADLPVGLRGRQRDCRLYNFVWPSPLCRFSTHTAAQDHKTR